AIDVGSYATPCLYDMDGDGKKDLVSGNQKGELHYMRNNSSTTGQVAFQRVTKTLGGISLTDREEPYLYTAPYIGTIDDTGIDYLMLGNKYGRIYRYTGFQNGAMPAQYTRLDTLYSYIQKGLRTTPAFANLDNDPQGLHELILGNLLGG